MNPGELNKRVTFQRRVAGADTAGQPLETWELVATLWARIRPLSSRELVAANAAQSERTHEITIRYRTGMTAAMRAVCAGRVFDLGPPVNAGEKNEWLVLPATEGMSDG